MNYPKELASRLTRAGDYVSISRYKFTGYYEVIKVFGNYFHTEHFDTGREAWNYYKTNKIN